MDSTQSSYSLQINTPSPQSHEEDVFKFNLESNQKKSISKQFYDKIFFNDANMQVLYGLAQGDMSFNGLLKMLT